MMSMQRHTVVHYTDATVKLDITQTADALAWSDLTVSRTHRHCTGIVQILSYQRYFPQTTGPVETVDTAPDSF